MAERMSVKKSLELRELLLTTPMTYEQLCEAGRLSPQRAAYWRKSNAENIFVSDWAPDKNGRLFVPVFSWGVGEDKPRPGRTLTSAERMRELRARRKQEAQAAEPPVAKAQTGGGCLADLF